MDSNNEENIINKNLDFRGFFARLWEMLAPSHGTMKKLLLLILVVEISKLVSPYFLKLIIDEVTRFNSAEVGNIIMLIIAMFFSSEVGSWFSYVADRHIFDMATEVTKYLSNDAQRKMVFLDLNYHERENTGNKIIKIQRGIDRIGDLISNFFWDVAPTIVQVAMTTAVLFFTDWRFGIIIMTLVPIFVTLTLVANKQAYPYRRKFYIDQEHASGLMTQSIININTVKSFVQEERENLRYETITTSIKNNFLKAFHKILKYNLGRNLVIDCGRALILVFGVYLAAIGGITLGTLVFVFTISEKSLISLYRIARLYDRIMESSEAVDRLHALYQEVPEIKNPENGYRPDNVEGKIEFKDVSFSYVDSSVKALDNINLTINPGQVTALVGPSGGGKTTIARMAYRHYDPNSGAVELDGRNLAKYDIFAFRKFFAIVPQEVEIFNASVKENIAYAKPEASFDEIVEAARIANAEEFITDLSEGYDTLVGERGIKLSGGQRQRIGIARAILADPKILIFDEATSSLDSYSEHLIQEAMDNISKGRTVIVIAHRLSTIKKADKIVVLEKGTVVEEGTHAELSKTGGGLYQKLIKLQEVGEVD